MPKHYICPRVVEFVSSDQKTITCLDFQPVPTPSSPVATCSSSTSATTATYFTKPNDALPTSPNTGQLAVNSTLFC